MINILVTGGCGYKGSVLVTKLLSLGHKVTVIDTQWFGNNLVPHNNLKVIKQDIRQMNTFDEKYDSIIHLAAVANDPSAELNPQMSWEINALSTMRLLDMAVRMGIKQFIYASSGSVYGVKDDPEVTEDLPLVPLSEYNKTKMVAERCVLSYKNDIDVVIIRPATVCGCSQRMRFDVVVNMLTSQAVENGIITVLGGEQERPHVHINDIINLYIFCIDNMDKVKDGIFNAGFENIKVIDIAEMVKTTVENCGIRKVDITTLPSNDPRSYHLNSDKIKSIGFKPEFTVLDAIEDIIFKYRQLNLKSSIKNYNVKWMKECGIV